MILSNLAFNSWIEVRSIAGINGMGEKVYKTSMRTRGHYTTKYIREKTTNAEKIKAQFTIHVMTPICQVGDLLVLDNKHRVIVSDIRAGQICEVIAYYENENAF